MLTRSAFLVLSLGCVSIGCATGEPIGEFVGFELGEEEDDDEGAQAAASEAMGQLFVDVTDAGGRPLWAQGVWVTVDDGDLRPAQCMQAGEIGCETWLADLEAGQRTRSPSKVTVFAEVCGLLHLESVSVSDGEPGFATHLVVVADDAACQPARAPRR
jgi:hypothetical protein